MLSPSSRRCRECGHKGLAAVTDGELINFFCPACGRCWQYELGFVHRMSPDTCPGCKVADVCRPSRRSMQEADTVGVGCEFITKSRIGDPDQKARTLA
jgi:hypothetical protein